MKAQIFSLIFITAVIISCDYHVEDGLMIVNYYRILPDRTIHTDTNSIDTDPSPYVNLELYTNYTVTSGAGTVARYTSRLDDPDGSDGESELTFTFEIDESTWNFYYSDDDFPQIKAYCQRTGEWSDGYCQPVTSGYISGHRVDDYMWNIEYNVTAAPVLSDQEPISLSGNATFKRSD